MRVAHIITRMIVGGAQENTLFNCLDLRRDHGDDVLLITGPALGPEGDLLAQGGAGDLPVCHVRHLRRAILPVQDWLAIGSIRRALQSFRPDVVHTHSAKAGMLGRRVAFQLSVPAIVHTVHGAPFHPYQSPLARRFFQACERRAAGWCDHMISVADAMTDLMVGAGVADRQKFTTIYSGMDVDPLLRAEDQRQEIRKRFDIRADQVVVGKIARLFHLKGHEDIISAAVDVSRQCPQVVFLLVGDGILRQPLQRRIDDLGLSKHFRFTGLVRPTEIPGLIGAMDVLAHTSYREGLARALPQALIAARPVVSYDVDGAREVAIPGETGFLVPPGDTKALAGRLIELISHPEECRRMGGAGRARFTETFRHQVMTARIRELYLRILAAKSTAP